MSEFVKSLSEQYSRVDQELLQRAYELAEKSHAGQKRASGEPYVSHCKAVAKILSEMHVPPAVVAASLLHDIVEDTQVSIDKLHRDFGSEISGLVQAVTKLDSLPRVSRSDRIDERGNEDVQGKKGEGEGGTGWRKELASENLRRTFLAMADDPRVVLIKLADRLHNMRTLHYLPPEKQKRIARETMDLFAPLASRIGIWQIKWDLEDLSFRYLEPSTYRDIVGKLDERRSEREREMNAIIERIKEVMKTEEIEADVTGRPKHIYSIYRKMKRKKIPFNQLHDIRGVRIIVPEEQDCYASVGIIHSHWRPLPGEFDDYIAAPKPSLYQSIHTSVVYDDGNTLEVQIRTPEMHRNAEFGIAAHWRYKEGKKRDKDFEQRVTYLRQMLEWQQDVESAQEFVDGLKTDVFGDQVYVFTPRGDIIDLPAGSTPIDFAYNIHTEVGHRCRGAKVNGRLVSLDHKLKTGDQVEILTAKRGGPSRDWLNENLGLVKTKRARSKIRRWFKRQERDKNVTSGKSLLDREIDRLDLGDNINFLEVAGIFRYESEEDLFEAVGCGDISIDRVMNTLVTIKEGEPAGFPAPSQEDISRETSGDIRVLGLKGLRNHLAGCCNPTPGDEIVGYITRGRGATIHRRDCPNILNIEDKERLVEVNWGSPERTFPVPVKIKAYDRDGLTRDIANLLSNNNISLSGLKVDVDHSRGEAVFNLVLGVRNVTDLRRILDQLERLNNVYEARRERSV
ncbi:MAG: bifunctional (p)ppGpp synthetase/guanosine-3',5'-bis(diphosphate) 3'-pyrophosphohydrolase [Anaerolineales bacterium]|nr:bifunctional (p)ppGpp synthetase/guanosine-3',5'-bis(diphosphate) 3'-pyrophosphohydrolase [Anaerolineales bacterium]MBS3751918.1 bifunctional (p)ppGpp synthetase/guanosine-3',5'-bis(diphosphate) 3'-pyrophosphohydrolase [Anaerolineales bacterium]